jgi:hypothetical protein
MAPPAFQGAYASASYALKSRAPDGKAMKEPGRPAS